MRSRATVSRGRGGFTLIEMLVVIAIIAILASLVATAAIKMAESGRRAQAEMDISALYKALGEYKFKYGDYPTNSTGGYSATDIIYDSSDDNRVLTILAKVHLYSFDHARLSDNGKGKFLDPWGNAYIWRETAVTSDYATELGMAYVGKSATTGIFIYSTGGYDISTTAYSSGKKDEQAAKWVYMKGGK